MAQIVRCPKCGKLHWLAGDQGTGRRCDSCGLPLEDTTTEPDGVPAAPLLSAQKRLGLPTSIITVAVVVGFMGLLVLVLTLSQSSTDSVTEQVQRPPVTEPTPGPVSEPDTWDRAAIVSVERLLEEARALARIDDLKGAIEKYRLVFRLVDNRTIVVPEMRALIHAARLEHDQAVDRLLHGSSLTPVSPTNTVPRTSPSDTNKTTPAPEATAGTPQTTGRPARKLCNPVLDGQNVSDEEIGEGIRKGIDFLLGQMDQGRLRVDVRDPSYSAGLNALNVYALLQAGLATNDARLGLRTEVTKAMLSQLCQESIQGNTETYARALRATALAVHNRPEDRTTLKDDVQWLLRAGRTGGYSYGLASGERDFDNSNSQYGLLGVWAGAEAGAEVPDSYWRAVEKHWTQCQSTTGQWGYGDGPARTGFAMNCAGLASLFVTHDYLDAPKFAQEVGRDPYSAALKRGLSWLEQRDNSVSINADGGMWFSGYNLYGIERVGLASGFKHFGAHDWYRELAARIIRSQRPNGAWSGIEGRGGIRGVGAFGVPVAANGEILDTTYILLFLSRGRHPILMNKLRYDGAWANRPRDASNLARFATRALERPLNWQVVSIDRDWTDWTDAPIVYLAGHMPPTLGADHQNKLRSFAHAGGMLFIQSDGTSGVLDHFASALAEQLFPGLPYRPVPASHPVFTAMFPMQNPPPLWGVNNGARLLMIYSPEDIASSWQLRAEQSRRDRFELGTNLFVYAAGKRDFRNRLTSPFVPDTADPVVHSMSIGRLRHRGQWNPEPMAHERLAKSVRLRLGWSIQIEEVDIRAAAALRSPIAFLTGTEAFPMDAVEAAALRGFVERGGLLIIDAFGASPSFTRSIETVLLPKSFPGIRLDRLPDEHPILKGTGQGMKPMTRLRKRSTSVSNPLAAVPEDLQLLKHGKGSVVFSELDLTSGLLGTRTLGIRGYEPEDASALIENALIWAADGCPADYRAGGINP